MNERIKLFLVVMCMPICACDMYKQQDCIGFVCFSTVTPRFLPLHTTPFQPGTPCRHTRCINLTYPTLKLCKLDYKTS